MFDNIVDPKSFVLGIAIHRRQKGIKDRWIKMSKKKKHAAASQKKTSNLSTPRVSDDREVELAISEPSGLAQMVMIRFAVVTLCKGVDRLLKEFEDLKIACPMPNESEYVYFTRNPDKNRYRDIYCLDKTRVILNWPPADGWSDYIHANWVTGIPDLQREIICTQAPTATTVEDFWRMIWQEKCPSILMLCSVIEGGRKKCEQYWPENVGERIKYPNLMLVVENLDVNQQEEVNVTKLLLRGKSSKDGKTEREHIVVHVQWTGWPDKSVPISSVGAVRAIVRTQKLSPLVVHCSAGVGRTGTIVTIEASLRTLLAGRELSVFNIVKQLRSMRYMACQTDLQYLYVHRAVIAYITSKKVMKSMEVERFLTDYEALVKERYGKMDLPGGN